MHDREKSDAAIVAAKPTNKAGARRVAVAESVERHGEAMLRMGGGDQEERGGAKHAPDFGPGSRVTGASTRTASRKAEEEGEVHRTPSSYQY
jgi:hypothetical protein